MRYIEQGFKDLGLVHGLGQSSSRDTSRDSVAAHLPPSVLLPNEHGIFFFFKALQMMKFADRYGKQKDRELARCREEVAQLRHGYQKQSPKTNAVF